MNADGSTNGSNRAARAVIAGVLLVLVGLIGRGLIYATAERYLWTR